jgi:phosphosulfolactate phosphohydrolase-like enzyme
MARFLQSLSTCLAWRQVQMERVATKKFVRTDALPASAWRCAGYDAIVCIDVLLSATTIVTALSRGRRVFTAPNLAHARWLTSRLGDALVLTDAADAPDHSIRFGGPTWLDAAEGTASLVLVSPLAEMISAALPQSSVYVACLRNLEATVSTIAQRHSRVAVLGVGEGGEVCSEDEMIASWLAERLRCRGFELEGRNTTAEVERWCRTDVTLVGWSRSAERLRAGGRAKDVDFVLEHVDDLDVVCVGGALPGTMALQVRLDDERPTHTRSTPVPALAV